MQTTIDGFEKRKAEIELYFEAIEQLYQEKDAFEGEEDKLFFREDFIKILKSNILLMIYNLVESSVMGGILEIYEELKLEGLSYQSVSNQLKEIWFSFVFDQVYDRNAHHNSYRDKTNQIMKAILEEKPIILDRKATAISGNLDAEKIRFVCANHGIAFNTPDQCRGGCVLEEVKEKRNQLAHGVLSFGECGRDYTLVDLETIKRETYIFIGGLLTDMKTYYDQKLYKIQS